MVRHRDVLLFADLSATSEMQTSSKPDRGMWAHVGTLWFLIRFSFLWFSISLEPSLVYSNSYIPASDLGIQLIYSVETNQLPKFPFT